jgi:hypothetical protein
MSQAYRSLLLLSLFSLISTSIYSMDEVQYESSYIKFSNQVYTSSIISTPGPGPDQSKVLVDVLWDRLDEKSGIDHLELKDLLFQVSPQNLKVEDQFRLYIMKKRLGVAQISDQKLLDQFYRKLMKGELSRRAVTLYYYYGKEIFKDLNLEMLRSNYSDVVKSIGATHESFRPKSKRELQDLVFKTPVSSDYKNGTYIGKPQLFMFCRHNRRYHCLMIMKDSEGELVRNQDGEIWHQHKLGLARKSVPYNERNGYTPSGIYTIDSVMPYADQQKTYGKFRRLIINFVNASENERNLKDFLPSSAHEAHWWKESVVARDVGRNLLRIHGTGRKNWNPFSRHYPFVKTSGCIMSREGEYGDTYFIDQRTLLDKVMLASELEPRFENEREIEGLLYLIEVSDENEHIYLPEIEWYLGLR